MKTINIKGKEYVTVNERLKEFRNNFKDYALVTEIIELGADFATVKASIYDDKGVLRATGFAREVVAKSPINKYAFLENCETSAIGRALGNFGIGIDEDVCTADELIQKLSHEDDKPQKTEFEKAATAEKTANTKAINQAIKTGATEVKKKPKTISDLKNHYQHAMDKLNSINDIAELNNTQIDFINNLTVELFEAKLETEHDTLCNLYNQKNNINDFIPH
jgi:hypothetical protein